MVLKKNAVFAGLLMASFILFGLMTPACGMEQPISSENTLAKATFAGGCFWCMEHPFDELEGVVATKTGYTGGQKVAPTYKEVSSGTTGHAESVQVSYDPKRVSYDELLEVFWHNIDPTDAKGQFCDKGNQYRTAIFYHDQQQQQQAQQSKRALAASQLLSDPIVTEIVPAQTFYVAEAYHQNYYQTHAVQYQFYRFACGRDQRLNELWGREHEG
ncbi:MAG: peptide-methionine (S)-S-oxide reductase MsrA [Cyanothece sp. SIO1E1]|nr:peptide-methionine (S)-S-oxide reductase MsrA [Cyanothece sp. SIO1E1]